MAITQDLSFTYAATGKYLHRQHNKRPNWPIDVIGTMSVANNGTVTVTASLKVYNATSGSGDAWSNGGKIDLVWFDDNNYPNSGSGYQLATTGTMTTWPLGNCQSDTNLTSGTINHINISGTGTNIPVKSNGTLTGFLAVRVSGNNSNGYFFDSGFTSGGQSYVKTVDREGLIYYNAGTAYNSLIGTAVNNTTCNELITQFGHTGFAAYNGTARTSYYSRSTTNYNSYNTTTLFNPPTGYHHADESIQWRIYNYTKGKWLNTSGASAASINFSTFSTDNLYWGDILFFFANWQIDSNTLKINPNGGTWNGSTSITSKTQNYATTLSIPNPTRTGYTFVGWIENSNGSLAKQESSQSAINGSWHGIGIYNNSGSSNGVVTHTLVDTSDSSWTGVKDIQITTASSGSVSPGLGGYHRQQQSAANKVFIHAFRAKVPAGYTLAPGFNQTGNGSTWEWLTSNIGTGSYETYAYKRTCGSSGTFSTLGYIYIYSGNRPVTWYLSCNVITDVTSSGDTYTFGYGNGGTGTLTALWVPNHYTNSISHWLLGFTNGEGNNGAHNAYRIHDDTSITGTYGTNLTLNSGWSTTLPNGCYLGVIGTDDVTGSWVNYPLGSTVAQKPNAMAFQCTYYPTDYNITYTMNGGTNNSSNPSTYNVLYGVTFATPTRTGYTFNGWTIGGTTVTGINPGANATFSSASDLYSKLSSRTTGNKTAVANWTANTYTVKYAAGGGTLPSGQTMANQTATYNANFVTRQNKYVRTGYTFNGWTDTLGGVWTLSSNGVYENGNGAHPWVWTYTSGITLTARWTPITSTVTLNKNGGTGGTNSVNIAYDTTVGHYPSITLPTRAGYTFAGYYDAATGGTQYYNASGNSVRTWNKVGDTTLYAHWTMNQQVHIKINNAWHTGAVWVKVNGTWEKASAVWIKVNGTWKQITKL